MVTSADVEVILAGGHELRGFEVKGPGDLSDKAYCAKVARAAMAMGNLRDGGLVCLGIDDTQLAAMVPGLSAEQFAAWSDYDDVHDALGRYSDPAVNFHLTPLTLSNGANVVVLEVSEFEQVPHICKKEYPGTLQKGSAYVRPPGKPQSIAIPSASEMRELLDLATSKGVREFVRRLGTAGLSFGGLQSVDDAAKEAFAAEADAAWSKPSDDLAFILSVGHFDIALTPSTFDPERTSLAALESLILNNAVRLRGWPVPYIDHQSPVLHHESWVGQDIAKAMGRSEAWRACPSGQVLLRRAFRADLGATDGQLQPDAPEATGAVIVWEVLFYLVEVAEFAARIVTTLGLNAVTINVALARIAGRQLISGDWNRELDRDYLIHADRINATKTVATPDLLADPRGAGIALAQALFDRFGLSVPDQVLRDWQEKTLRA